MPQTPNTLFHNRYLLIQLMGRGASAEVWKAYDTTANNLVVAIKIFSESAGFDSYGFQNFQKEFTTVFNLKHSNLLPPSGYDVCEGKPYLIMQFCQNGSAASMIGHASEADVIRMLHDVSGGLAYLHDHNIIHQDIKPDNILLDGSRNFMVTDFGISDRADSLASGQAMSGGTRGYMGPERTRGIVNNASDIWALGATAYEMLTGELPFGEHGGVAQFSETISSTELKNLQPQLREIIADCLQKDPAKRPTAQEIYQKTTTYLETGQWERASKRKFMTLALTSIASVLLVAGIFLWDYNRVKVRYYNDYAEYYGIPKGVGRISEGTAQKRNESYRFEYRKGKVQRISHVNGRGKVTPLRDTENMVRRYPDTKLFYTDGGKIDYKEIYDSYGCLLFKLDYASDLKSATFLQPDEYGSELMLPANVNDLYGSKSGIYVERSNISRYLLTFDDKGLLTKMLYAGYQNSPRHDTDNIYGHVYTYNDDGLMVEDQFVNIEGEPTADHNGMSKRVFGYDDDNQWISVEYLTIDGGAAHEGNNTACVKIEYDKNGNRSRESYYTLEGEPTVRTDINASSITYVYDKHGNNILESLFDVDGNPAYTPQGFSALEQEYDDNGFSICSKYLDGDGKPVMCNFDGDAYAIVRNVNDDRGLMTRVAFYDAEDEPIEIASGWHSRISTYDENGNELTSRFYDIEGMPALERGQYHGNDFTYDEVNNITSYIAVDFDGKPVARNNAIAIMTFEYNKSGAITKVSYRDANGDLALGAQKYAQEQYTYDESGNRSALNYLNTKGVITNVGDGYGREEYEYDPETNSLVKITYKRANGTTFKTTYRNYDDKGRIIKSWDVNSNGALEPGDVVTNNEYDSNNNNTRQWYTDLNGRLVNNADGVAQYLYKHDKNGNIIELSVLDPNGNPTTDTNHVYRQVREYDSQNRRIHEVNYGVDGKPATAGKAEPERAYKYDSQGNLVEVAYCDGYGNPYTKATGHYKCQREYNNRNQLVVEQYLDENGNLVVDSASGAARAEAEYDSYGNLAMVRHFDAAHNCTKIEKHKYNDKGNQTEYLITNGNGGEHPDAFISKMVVEYDDSGVVPTYRYYYQFDGTEVGVEKYMPDKNDWVMYKLWGQRVYN